MLKHYIVTCGPLRRTTIATGPAAAISRAMSRMRTTAWQRGGFSARRAA